MIMRKWHRWMSLFFGIFMLWMAVTGLIIHVNDLLKGDGDRPARPAVAAPVSAIPVAGSPDAMAKPFFVCPPDMVCRPKQKPGKLSFAGLIKHLHSGEIAGPVGTALSILSGLALAFFSISGMWMYVQMWRFRRSRKLSPHWFWK